MKHPKLPPDIISSWVITDILYISSKSQIFLISSKTDNTMSILKIISENKFNQRISDILLRIDSENIISPVIIKRYKKNYYIIFPYLSSIRDIVFNKNMTLPDIVDMTYDIAKSIQILHSNKILHLDISPQNIYQKPNGSYCLGDFSSSFLMSEIVDLNTVNITSEYAAPEIKNGDIPTCLSDIYSLGLTALTLLNNGEIFNNNEQIIENNIPVELQNILLKCISKYPQDRYQTISELVDKLKSFKETADLSEYNYTIHLTNKRHIFFKTATTYLVEFQNTKFKSQNKLSNKLLYFFLLLTSALLFSSAVFYHFNRSNPKKRPSPMVSTNTYTFTAIPTPTTDVIYRNRWNINNQNLSSIPVHLPDNICYSSVQYLYAQSNMLTSTKYINKFSNLRELYLTDNKIKDTSHLSKLKNLKILIISYNRITDLSDISQIKSLTDLDLSGNTAIKNFKLLSNLNNLKSLYLTNTTVTHSEIRYLTKKLPECTIFY